MGMEKRYKTIIAIVFIMFGFIITATVFATRGGFVSILLSLVLMVVSWLSGIVL